MTWALGFNNRNGIVSLFIYWEQSIISFFMDKPDTYEVGKPALFGGR